MIEPTTMEEVRDLYGVIDDTPLLASHGIQYLIFEMKALEEQIEELKNDLQKYKDIIVCFMKNKSTLVNDDGEVIVTFKASMPSESFNSKLFKSENKELYSKYVEIKPGSRRFLVK